MPKPSLVPSYAKINLFLDIICKRADGYHNIETVFQAIDLHDELSIELLPSGLEIRCNDPAVPCDARNLAVKAFSAFAKTAKYTGGIRIIIDKRIPPGSGLGGGSSNAAAVLLACNRLLHAEIPENKLREIAQQLGADVPFFLSGGLAAAWGIGEKLASLPSLPECFLVVAVPDGVSVSTALAYSKITAPQCAAPPPESISGCSARLQQFVSTLSPSLPLSANPALLSLLYNELEEPVFSLFPQVAGLKIAMLQSGAKAALMSGSGSAVFGVADNENDAHRIRQALMKSCACTCFVTKSLGTDVYLNR